MAINRPRGLGKGLNELLAATLKLSSAEASDAVAVLEHPEALVGGSAGEPNTSSYAKDKVIVELPIDRIKPGPFQPRNIIDQGALQQLADSIKLQGVIQPIVVRSKKASPGEYEILAGERRWRASQLAGLELIPVVVKEVSDEVAMVVGLIENIQREDLNPVEQAKALKRLADELQLTHLQVAELLGKSRASITNLLRLLSLNADVLMLLEHKEMEMGHARALLSLQGNLQSQVAKTVVKRHLSVRETERIVAKLQESGKGKVPAKAVDPDIRRLEQDLADKLGSPVAIRHTMKGTGMLMIRYASSEELDGILAHFMIKEEL